MIQRRLASHTTILLKFVNYPTQQHFVQSAGAVEYTDCTSAEGVRPPPQ